jgi:molybdopterin-binding protein
MGLPRVILRKRIPQYAGVDQKSVKISARNKIVGTVSAVEAGAVAALVKVDVKDPFTMTSMITKEAVEDLGLKKGDRVSVIIKSTEVIIAKD